jgi:DNA-binding MarR family transcriptional regulator
MNPVIEPMEHKSTKGAIEVDIEERGPIADRLLFWLLKHPYQRGSDLAFIFQVAPSTIWRHLQTLRQHALVESVTPASATSSRHPDVLYYLTSRGIERVADLVGGAHPARLARMWKANEAGLLQLLPRLASYLPLQDAVLRFIADSPRQLAYSGGYPAAIRWHWQHDYVHPFERKKRRLSCRADGVVVFRRRPLNAIAQKDGIECWYCVLWLFDPGFYGGEDLSLMRERCEQLLLWRESSERWSFYQTFPPLLVLAPTPHQRDLWIHYALEAATHLRVAPLKGACAMQVEDTPWRYPWYRLDGSGAITLQSLVTPLAQQALPPGLLAPKQIDPGTFRKRTSNKDKIVVGNFQTRAEHLETNKADLKSMTTVSLFSVSMPHRYSELLQQIYAVPLIAPRELAALLRRDVETLQRYLFDLQRLNCLEILPTTCEKRLVLTETGLRLIAGMLGVRMAHLAERDGTTHQWRQRGVRQALRTIEHTAGIYTFLAQLQRQARKIGQEVRWWETTRCFRRYHYQGAWHNLMPDALFEYQAKESRVEAWLEWDTGSMHLKPMTVKFEAYAQYMRSQYYRQEHKTAPILLLVAPQNGREQSLRHVAATIFGTLPITLWTTTEQLLNVQSPQAAIWKPMRSGLNEEDIDRSTWVGQ